MALGQPRKKEKICKGCGILKPRADFSERPITLKGKPTVHIHTHCKSCEPSYNKHKNKRHQTTRELAKWKNYFGQEVTHKMRKEKLKAQNYSCGICKDDLSNQKANWDHDHSTGKLRDFLCDNCNKGLGLFDDDPHLLNLALLYLKKHSIKETD